MRVQVSAFLIMATALATGCAALPGGGPAPLDTYELTAPDPDTRGRARGRTQILVAEPSALKSLDGENIVVRPTPGTIQFLKGAQWGDRLPRVIQARLVETFQSTGRIAGVGRPGEGLAIDFQVIAEIRAFEIVLSGGGSRARVDLYVKVLNDRNGQVRASRSFDATAAVSGQGNDAYAAALDRAFGEAAAAIVEWTIGVI